jgi:hypothetical protein
MPHSLHITDTASHLLIATSGSMSTLDELLGYAEDILSELLRRKQTRVLVDERALTMHLDAYDLITLADRLDARGLAVLGIRTAAICSATNFAIEKMLETALNNRSLTHRAFLDEDEALAWLLG